MSALPTFICPSTGDWLCPTYTDNFKISKPDGQSDLEEANTISTQSPLATEKNMHMQMLGQSRMYVLHWTAGQIIHKRSFSQICLNVKTSSIKWHSHKEPPTLKSISNGKYRELFRGKHLRISLMSFCILNQTFPLAQAPRIDTIAIHYWRRQWLYHNYNRTFYYNEYLMYSAGIDHKYCVTHFWCISPQITE